MKANSTWRAPRRALSAKGVSPGASPKASNATPRRASAALSLMGLSSDISE